MTVTTKDIRNIAHLARIELSEQDLTNATPHFNKLLHLVEQMNAIDTNEVTPLVGSIEMHQRLRDDEVTELNAREVLQKLAPSTVAGLYLVPAVIE